MPASRRSLSTAGVAGVAVLLGGAAAVYLRLRNARGADPDLPAPGLPDDVRGAVAEGLAGNGLGGRPSADGLGWISVGTPPGDPVPPAVEIGPVGDPPVVAPA